MRLIDADKIEVNENAIFTGAEIKKFLDDIPTSYDMDKILDKLENKALEHDITGQQYGEDGWLIFEEREQYAKQGIDEAIEIVKSGGVSDD